MSCVISGFDSEIQALDLVHDEPGHLKKELLISICLNVWNLDNIDMEVLSMNIAHSP